MPKNKISATLIRRVQENRVMRAIAFQFRQQIRDLIFFAFGAAFTFSVILAIYL